MSVKWSLDFQVKNALFLKFAKSLKLIVLNSDSSLLLYMALHNAVDYWLVSWLAEHTVRTKAAGRTVTLLSNLDINCPKIIV